MDWYRIGFAVQAIQNTHKTRKHGLDTVIERFVNIAIHVGEFNAAFDVEDASTRYRRAESPFSFLEKDYLRAQKASEAKWVLSVKSSTTSSQGVLAR